MPRLGLRPRFLALLGAAALAAGAAWAQEGAVYRFFLRKDLARLIAENSERAIGQKVVVTDELTVIWPEAQERKNVLDGEDYVLFDTTYFRCAVPTSALGTHLQSIWEDARRGYAEVIQKIEETNAAEARRELSPSEAAERRRQYYWELYRVWSNKPIVTIYGTCDRHDFWGQVHGKSQGVRTEAVTLVVDKVEKPRKRWYRSLDD